MSRLRALTFPLTLAVLMVAPAEATTTYYQGSTGEATFNSSVLGLTLMNPGLTFSSADLGSGGLFNASGTGIDFLGFDTAFSFNIPENFTVNSGKLTGQAAEVAEITFPGTGIYAFGFHLTVTSGTGNWCIDLTQAGCAHNVFNSSSSDVQFFGIVSDAPVTAPLYIHYVSGSPAMVFTNFEAFTATQTPEPEAMLLVGFGLITLALLRRRTFRNSQAREPGGEPFPQALRPADSPAPGAILRM
jgi:PEP-CTERM motif